MKRLISVILSIILVCCLFTSCNIDTNDKLILNEVEQTNNELTIRINSNEELRLSDVFAEFRKKYPDIELTVQNFEISYNYDEYYKKLSADIMAGQGPDLFFLNYSFYKYYDVCKLMSSGVFADLNEFFNNDTDFNIDDYNETVFNSGVYKDKRYIAPINYQIPLMLSTESIIKETGFNVDNCKDFFGFTNEVTNYINKNKHNKNAKNVFRISNRMDNYYDFMGEKILDYENKEVNFDSDNFKKAAEFYKLLYPQDSIDLTNEMGFGCGCRYLKSKTMILENYGKSTCFEDFFLDIMGITSFDTPVILPLYDTEGGLQATIGDSLAIRSNSANKQNAYNFIKLMLSPVYKGNYFFVPTNNSSARDIAIDLYTTGKFHCRDVEGINFQILPVSYVDEYMKIASSVTGTNFRKPWEDKFLELMEPFYKGKESFEDCIKNAKDEMEIYITE